jgi:hypothetical protein
MTPGIRLGEIAAEAQTAFESEEDARAYLFLIGMEQTPGRILAYQIPSNGKWNNEQLARFFTQMQLNRLNAILQVGIADGDERVLKALNAADITNPVTEEAYTLDELKSKVVKDPKKPYEITNRTFLNKLGKGLQAVAPQKVKVPNIKKVVAVEAPLFEMSLDHRSGDHPSFKEVANEYGMTSETKRKASIENVAALRSDVVKNFITSVAKDEAKGKVTDELRQAWINFNAPSAKHTTEELQEDWDLHTYSFTPAYYVKANKPQPSFSILKGEEETPATPEPEPTPEPTPEPEEETRLQYYRGLTIQELVEKAKEATKEQERKAYEEATTVDPVTGAATVPVRLPEEEFVYEELDVFEAFEDEGEE